MYLRYKENKNDFLRKIYIILIILLLINLIADRAIKRIKMKYTGIKNFGCLRKVIHNHNYIC